MSSVSEKAKAALIGAFVADAATMGFHWIYDGAKRATLLEEAGKVDAPEFFEPPSCPFYQAPAGSFSPYGNELLALSQYLAEAQKVEGQALSESLAKFYEHHTGYLNHSSKTLRDSVKNGLKYPNAGDEKDTQANCFVKAAAVVALYVGKPELAQAAETATRAQQNNDTAAHIGVASALILEKVVLGHSVLDALKWALTHDSGIAAATTDLLKVALDNQSSDLAALLAGGPGTTPGLFGPSCANPGALQGALVAALQAPDYVSGIRANIKFGGDNCSRGVFIGALLAAQHGLSSIPQEWRDKTTHFSEVEALADKILAHHK